MGHTYNKHAEVTIRCNKKTKCPGLPRYQNGIINLLTAHTCKPSNVAIKAKLATRQIIQNARESAESTRAIAINGMSQLDDGISRFFKLKCNTGSFNIAFMTSNILLI